MSVLSGLGGFWRARPQTQQSQDSSKNRDRGDSTDLFEKEIPHKKKLENLVNSTDGWDCQHEEDGYRAEIKADLEENRFYGRGTTVVNCNCDQMFQMFCNKKLSEKIDENLKIDVLEHDPIDALTEHEREENTNTSNGLPSTLQEQTEVKNTNTSSTASLFDPLEDMDGGFSPLKGLGLTPNGAISEVDASKSDELKAPKPYMSRFATRVVFNSFWPVAPREFLTSTFVMKRQDGSCISVSYHDEWLLQRYPEPTPHAVRGESPIAAYHCQPLEGESNRCNLTYVFSFDPKGWIPKYLADRHTVHGCNQVLKLKTLIDEAVDVLTTST